MFPQTAAAPDDLFYSGAVPDPTETFVQKLTGHLEGDQPLSIELGLSDRHILHKTAQLVNPFCASKDALAVDPDLVGPFLFYLLFGLFLLFSGRMHFGYIYGVVLSGWVLLYFFLNLIGNTEISGTTTGSIIGYGGIPLLLPAAGSIVLSTRGMVGAFVCLFATLWCAACSTAYIVQLLGVPEKKLVVAYPLFLFYAFFAVLVAF